MKMGLVGMTGAEPSLLAWQVALDRAGTPHEVLALQDRDGRARLTSAMRRGGFQALIIAGAEIIETALSTSERAELEALERARGTRRLLAYAYPGPTHGLRPAFWAGPLDGLRVSLTPRGRRVFPYLHGTLEFDAGSWGYLAAPISAGSFETLLAAPDGSPLLGLYRHRDGRETMVQTFAANASQSHALLLRFGQLAWVSGGSYLGFERNYLPVHIDDVLLANHSWNVATHRTDDDPRATIRMTAADVARAAGWSRARRLRLDMVCNGGGSERYRAAAGLTADPVLDALLDERSTFGWINHTYSHGNLDKASRTTIEAEIERNVRWAERAGIELEPGALVTGEHSGLANLEATPRRPENPELPSALRAQRVRYIACDASRPYPVCEVGRGADLLPPGMPFVVGPALAIPRHPTALPFDSATRSQAVDRWRSHRRTEPAPTWEEVLASEAARIFVAMLANDPCPHYFHQSNLVSSLDGETPEGALLYELLDAVLQRYESAVHDMPIVQPRFGEVGELLRDRTAWRAARAAGAVVAYREAAGVRIANDSGAALRVPLTGTVAGGRYGVTRSGWILAEPGETLVALETGSAAA